MRWERIEQRARWRRRLRLILLLALTLVLTTLLAAVLLAGKTAIDPTYSPPLFSRSTVTGGIVSPAQGHELVSSSGHQPKNPAVFVKLLTGRELDYPAEANLDVHDLAQQRLLPTWILRRVGGHSPHKGLATVATPVPIRSNNESLTLSAVLRDPLASGTYLVELTLTAEGSVVGRLKSKAFYAIGSSCCRLYATPSYSASLPTGWKLKDDFIKAPGHRHVTELVSTSRMTILIDTTSHEHGDPRKDQRVLENLLEQGTERYARVALRRFSADNAPVEEWSYWSGHDIYTNELFYRGHNGFAILGRSSLGHFREVRDICRIVMASLRSK